MVPNRGDAALAEELPLQKRQAKELYGTEG